MAENFWLLFWKNLHPFKDAIKFITLLKKNKNLKLGIVSNGTYTRQLEKISKTGLRPYFSKDNIFISSAFPKAAKKPAPQMILKMLKQTESKASQTIFYGNADIDLLAGRLAKVTTAALNLGVFYQGQKPNFFKSDYSFTSWQEVIKSLDNFSKSKW